MKVIGRFKGKLGEIYIWENERDGSRMYLEGEIFQSHSTPAGESQFKYIQMMDHFLARQSDVLVLGCGRGNLATMLARTGKAVVVVDHNPTSFDIARTYVISGRLFALCAYKVARLKMAQPQEDVLPRHPLGARWPGD